jgi:molybdate transport system substrate-binding protein
MPQFRMVALTRTVAGSRDSLEKVWRNSVKPGSCARVLCALGVATLSLAGARPAAEVHVMISAGYFAVYSELAPAFERATGHRLVTSRGPSIGDSPEAIPARLTRGEIADVVILDGEAADELGRRGLVRTDTKVELAGSLIGMVVRAGAAKPDIGSVETFRRTLRIRIVVAAPIYQPCCLRGSVSPTK